MNTQVPKWVWYGAGLLAILAIGLAGLYMFRVVFTPPPGGGGEFALVRQMMQILEAGYRHDGWSRFWATIMTGIGFLMAISIPSLGIAVLLYRGREAFGKNVGTIPDTAQTGDVNRQAGTVVGRGRDDPLTMHLPDEAYPHRNGYPDEDEDPRVVGGYRFPVSPRPDFSLVPECEDDPDIPCGVHDPEGRFAQYLRDRNAA